MSANFYTTGPQNGMIGVDLHLYFALGPAGAPLPTANHPHVAATSLEGPNKPTSTVSADGFRLWKEDAKTHSMHMPLPVPLPHPGEVAWLAIVIGFSSSQAKLVVHSVSGNGAPLACCVVACLGRNFNCGDVLPLRLENLVVSISTVKTQPTWRDFLAAAVGIVLDALFDWILKKAFKFAFDDLMRKLEELGTAALVKLIRWLLEKFSWLRPLLDPKILEPILRAIKNLPIDKAWKQIEKQIGKVLTEPMKELARAISKKFQDIIAGNTTALGA